jgi:hypothetical protein
MLGRTLHPTPCRAYSHIGASRSCCGIGSHDRCRAPKTRQGRACDVGAERSSAHPTRRERICGSVCGGRDRTRSGRGARRGKSLGGEKGFVPIGHVSGVMIAPAAAPGKTACDARANQFDEPGTSCRGTFSAKRNSDADAPHPAHHGQKVTRNAMLSGASTMLDRGMAIAWPLAHHAQQPIPALPKRVGVPSHRQCPPSPESSVAPPCRD